jgi:cytochrome c peroxidase
VTVGRSLSPLRPTGRALAMASALGVAACGGFRAQPTNPAGRGETAPVTIAGTSSRPRVVPRGLDLLMPSPANNPLRPHTVALGRRLFFDRMLSSDGSVACASCHDPARAFAGGRTIAVGADGRSGRRNVPALVNRGYGRAFFWDGRAATLEAQVLQPIVNPLELGAALPTVVSRLANDATYAAAFQVAFGRAPNADDLARALASYVRTIVSGDSPFDRTLAGPGRAMSPDARRGMSLFFGRAECWLCHAGPTLTDEQFHNTGIAWQPAAHAASAGRFTDDGRFAVTRRAEDRGAFKTPGLREVARTAPYMHDGSVATLEEVVAHYNRGGRPNPHLDRRLRPLGLGAGDLRDLVAFLRALSGRVSEGQ